MTQKCVIFFFVVILLFLMGLFCFALQKVFKDKDAQKGKDGKTKDKVHCGDGYGVAEKVKVAIDAVFYAFDNFGWKALRLHFGKHACKCVIANK